MSDLKNVPTLNVPSVGGIFLHPIVVVVCIQDTLLGPWLHPPSTLGSYTTRPEIWFRCKALIRVNIQMLPTAINQHIIHEAMKLGTDTLALTLG
jgi:hypothetical protein